MKDLKGLVLVVLGVVISVVVVYYLALAAGIELG